MKKLPNNLSSYKRTSDFNETTMPKGLLKAHQTPDSVWAKIIVLKGTLEYSINSKVPETIMLDKDNIGIIEPFVLHQVKAIGEVVFYLEFYK